MLTWPIRWLLSQILQAVVGLILVGVFILWLFRWVPMVPVAVVAELVRGEAPRWQWLSPEETPSTLLQAFRMRLSQTRQKSLSLAGQAAAVLLFPNPQKAPGAEILGTLLKLLWGEERLYHCYLSSAPWGPHLWGAKAAALHYLRKEPEHLSPEDAAELILLREYPQAAHTPTRPPWFQKQKLTLAYQLTHASPQKHP